MIHAKKTQPRSLRWFPVISVVLSSSPTIGLAEIDTTHHFCGALLLFSPTPVGPFRILDASSEYRMIAPAPDPYTPVTHSSYPTFCTVLDRVLSSISLQLHFHLSILLRATVGFLHKIISLNRFTFCCSQSFVHICG